MVDAYTIGSANRISPEAPVAVVAVQREEKRPGGAGNVALNLVSLGAKVSVLGRVGDDVIGRFLIESLEQEGIDTSWVGVDKQWPTSLKNRILADMQQVVRVDHESTDPIHPELEESLIQSIDTMLEKIDLVAISDYAKGFLSTRLLSALIGKARSKGIPVITDPKGVEWKKYSGSFLIKPNLSEAVKAAGLEGKRPLAEIAEVLFREAEAEYFMVTRGSEGISLFNQQGHEEHFAVRMRSVKDVTGAGDTVLAMLSASIASGLTLNQATELANVAAGIAIEEMGCHRVTLTQLAHRLLEIDRANKIFDEDHLFVLEKALGGRSVEFLSVDTRNGFSPDLLQAIHSRGKQGALVIHVEDESPNPLMMNALASLNDVEFIIQRVKDLEALSSRLA